MHRLKWLLIIPVLLIPGSPWIMKWIALHKARKQLGWAAPDTSEVDADSMPDHRVYYFHAPYCGPCKAMMPMIDALRKTHPGLIKVDVTEHEQLAQAFGVSATPTFIAVENNHVAEVKVGSQGEPWIRRKLEGE